MLQPEDEQMALFLWRFADQVEDRRIDLDQGYDLAHNILIVVSEVARALSETITDEDNGTS